ncbi:thiamine pyrophosphate-binding protein [Bradyrhizobium sp. dw_411]|uniref:alpha-keto acid decarboxylase family protein n=1 Tax=Bradyrhizobium sp. dw_411 TaxID=2720082 RepID=UPI001BCFB835|nr:thiamine pyrophosphate-binding protein [Bradyrhizobium sp. dw_411]
MTKTVIQHVLSRLHDIGITDVFGVPGDYSFPVNDAICNDPDIRWIGCCNELNAAYAADGYARVKGVAALCTTYGVGELSAINGVAGSYAEHLPVFHLVGTPNISTQAARALMHHTLGNGEYDLFRRMSEPVVCAHAVMTPQNVAYETERLIAEALYHRRPVYMAFPADLANQPVLGEAKPISQPLSDVASLGAATDAIAEALGSAASACVLPGILVARAGLQPVMRSVIDSSGLPFATMFMAKSVLDERHPGYVGMYDGALMNEKVRVFVEGCDLVLNVGSPLTDFNTGAFTSRLDPAKTISIGHHRTQVNGKVYPNVEMGDVLAALARLLPRRNWKKPVAQPLGVQDGSGKDAITAERLYPRWENFLQPNDILIAETGTVSMGLGFALMPAGSRFHNQTLWGSIGWATPAAFGAAVAAPGQRVVLVTGDGSHQFTVQEISQFARLGIKPVIFVLNNNGYLIERLLCKDPEIAYNDIAPWHYAELPRAFGCDDWITARVTNCGELDYALALAARTDVGVYIEVVTDAYAASPLALKLHDAVKTLYKA